VGVERSHLLRRKKRPTGRKKRDHCNKREGWLPLLKGENYLGKERLECHPTITAVLRLVPRWGESCEWARGAEKKNYREEGGDSNSGSGLTSANG